MDVRERAKLSKFLSFVLRHEPEAIGVALDEQGWVPIERLLAKCYAHGERISRDMLDEIVASSEKQRFAISADGERIRASHGHSFDVELGYELAAPPKLLYHGTVVKFLDSIQVRGLQPMGRRFVHLSTEVAASRAVGARRGKPIVLSVLAKRMYDQGYAFYLATSGIWLTVEVPPDYLRYTI